MEFRSARKPRFLYHCGGGISQRAKSTIFVPLPGPDRYLHVFRLFEIPVASQRVAEPRFRIFRGSSSAHILAVDRYRVFRFRGNLRTISNRNDEFIWRRTYSAKIRFYILHKLKRSVTRTYGPWHPGVSGVLSKTATPGISTGICTSTTCHVGDRDCAHTTSARVTRVVCPSSGPAAAHPFFAARLRIL